MKKLFIVLSFVFLGQLFAQSFATENIKNYYNQNYYQDWAIANLSFTLDPGGTYSAEYESGGRYWYNSGKYEQRKDILQLFPDVCKEGASYDIQIDCNQTLGNAHVELIFDNTSLYYTQYLKITSEDNSDVLGMGTNNFLLPVPDKKVPAGEPRTFNGEKVITMANAIGVATIDLKIRKTPSIKGQVLPFLPILFSETSKTVPKETPMIIVARTESKVKIKKWENYWYLVNIGAMVEVWVYGQFVKLN